ncbi:hypothetical protein D9M69_641610 [compost metagenome]
MCIKKILLICRISSYFGIKVNTSALETAGLQDDQHRFCQLIDIVRKLIGVPAVLVISAVGINRAQHSRVNGHLKLMLKGVSGQGGVVHLQV